MATLKVPMFRDRDKCSTRKNKHCTVNNVNDGARWVSSNIKHCTLNWYLNHLRLRQKLGTYCTCKTGKSDMAGTLRNFNKQCA